MQASVHLYHGNQDSYALDPGSGSEIRAAALSWTALAGRKLRLESAMRRLLARAGVGSDAGLLWKARWVFGSHFASSVDFHKGDSSR